MTLRAALQRALWFLLVAALAGCASLPRFQSPLNIDAANRHQRQRQQSAPIRDVVRALRLK